DRPESLFHIDDDSTVSPDEWVRNEERRRETVQRLNTILSLQTEVWRWISLHLQSEWEQRNWEGTLDGESAQETPYVNFLEEERRLREEDILALQEYTLQERVDRFRAIGPLTFSEMSLDDEGCFLYGFHTSPEVGLSKFREGDFLKLVPVGMMDLQSGFPVLLTNYDRNAGRLWVRSRQGRLILNKRLVYSLEEDITDWNGPKLVHAVRTVFSADSPHPLSRLLTGRWPLERDPEDLRWVKDWLITFGSISGLNPTQQQALELPFRHRLSLIEGPPGTGKTHLLGWTLIALIQRAQESGTPLRIGISALTHQAIDQVLKKVVELVNRYGLHDFPGRCLKWGRRVEDEPETEGKASVELLTDVDDLAHSPYPILGATGFGLYQLLDGRGGTFPKVFDWVVFDEASQVLIPQALLSLLYGTGNFVFCGDVKQLPPIILGDYEDETDGASGVHHSIMSHLLNHYGPMHRIRLDHTYRMNEEICAFPSRMWYDGTLHAAPGNAHLRLILNGSRRDDTLDRVLDPEQPVVLLLVDHRGCHQQSELEVEVVTELTYRLMAEHGLSADQLALISPHRAQNNATADRLIQRLGGGDVTLPLIDTVERVQGAERDVILFALTTSDLDSIGSEFLNNPNRFNVAITRAKRKLIVVGSRAFFSTVPRTEEALKANSCFKAFFEFCREKDSLFFWEGLSFQC
ncbi:MAG: AAA family ATPase, partial [Candidatus Latescibacteria bacterium]|nr:AAA family ATPase [Candidatus Latescibacterota bacterium]